MNYPQQTTLPEDYLKRKIEEFLQEDCPDGDKTTEGIFSGKEKTTAIIQAEDELVFAGTPIINEIFSPECRIEIFRREGELIEKGGVIARIKGQTAFILTRERVLLNLLQRLSGIATQTNEIVKMTEPYKIKVLDTRKTTPGLRIFEKYAVTVGGGTNHRFCLSSGILIKDNHIQAAGGITEAIKKIRAKDFGMLIEVEVENLDQLEEGIAAKADGFLLDNMNPDEVKACVKIVRSEPDGERFFIEASGGLNLKNLHEYLKTGLDAVSIGALTHSVKSADIHLEFI